MAKQETIMFDGWELLVDYTRKLEIYRVKVFCGKPGCGGTTKKDAMLGRPSTRGERGDNARRIRGKAKAAGERYVAMAINPVHRNCKICVQSRVVMQVAV